MPVTYDASFRLAVVALARIEGAYAAARLAHVSVNTVKSWMHVDEGQDHDAAEWDSAQKLAQSRHLQALIAGKSTGVGQWAMSAGISARNKRMVAVQRRWDARKAAEQEPEADPEADARAIREAIVDGMTAAQIRLSRTEIDVQIAEDDLARQQPGYVEPADTPGTVDALLRAYAALTPEEVAARQAIADARWEELNPGWRTPAPRAPTLITDGTPEAVRARLATDVTPGAPEPPEVPQIGSDGVWRESSGSAGEEWQWQPWGRFDQ
ncbi:MAG: hypothetical protein H0W81_04770 [Chloroflexi bacterium]|nr:hypothetical protein [Chloroflexota bacterium]